MPSRNFPGGVTCPLANSDPTFSKGEKQSISGLFLSFKHKTTLKRYRTVRFLQCQLVFRSQKCCFDENCLARKNSDKASVRRRNTAALNVQRHSTEWEWLNESRQARQVAPPSSEFDQWHEILVYLAPRNRLRPGLRRFCKRGGWDRQPFIIFNPFFLPRRHDSFFLLFFKPREFLSDGCRFSRTHENALFRARSLRERREKNARERMIWVTILQLPFVSFFHSMIQLNTNTNLDEL